MTQIGNGNARHRVTLPDGTEVTIAWAATTDAPVWPTLTSAAASPRATHSAATRIDARGFRRSASAGDSAIPITSLASITRTSSVARSV